MTAYHFYVLVGGCYACYVLGMKHARGQSGWQNTVAVLLFGALWPLAVVVGAWIWHSEKGTGRA